MSAATALGGAGPASLNEVAGQLSVPARVGAARRTSTRVSDPGRDQ